MLTLGLLLAVQATWTFATGEPSLTSESSVVVPMEAEAYAAFAERMAGNPRFVVITRKPPNLSPNARFGFNFVVGEKNRGWILDGDPQSGYRLYLDWKGNGDLSDAEPRQLEQKNGVYSIEIDVPDGAAGWPCRLAVGRARVGASDVLAMRVYTNTARRGVIELEGKHIPFSLNGRAGRYDEPYHTVALDRSGSGQVEIFEVRERTMNLLGHSYEFEVAADGRGLALRRLAELLPDRPSLLVGSAAPPFVAEDLAGRRHRLADFKGRIVLVEFWATSCAPCRAEAPSLAAFYRRTRRDRLEIVGVSSDDSADALGRFLSQFEISWPQVREPWDGTLHRTYRVRAEPTYFLIGAEGQILDRWEGAGDTVARISKHLSGDGR